MWGPIKHHRALGIHPGAFVQSTAPSTADVQDGVLWVDISSGPPYPLKMWDAGAGVWRDVGTSGIVGPPGPGFPPGTPGAILYYDGAAWVVLPIGQSGQDLAVTPVGMRLLPRWQPCCGADAISPPPIVTTGGTDTGGGTLQTTVYTCGAALEMATRLEQTYLNIAQYLDPIVTQALKLALSGLTTALIDALTAGFGIPASGLIFTGVYGLASILIGSFRTTEWGPLTSTQKNTILGSVFCALPKGTNTFTVDKGMLSAWQDNLRTNGAVFSSTGQRNLLTTLIMIPSLASWNVIAATGAESPSVLCDEFICPAGKSLQGGAMIGGQGHALSGGAVVGTLGGLSLSGGGTYGTASLPSLSGGGRT